ncbi:hypothetical protein [Agromyces sp. Soil535]|uniref:hypothetical protein n=1 Tax=Agromyces sp. Soil535 TaxID=1736390 RepID=UPI0012E37AA1|nr:hypothetical protein [Agromyces sp. Soil535]
MPTKGVGEMDATAILNTFIGSLLSGAVIVTFIRLLTLRWEKNVETRIQATVGDEFRKIAEIREADRALLYEVLGPVCGNLARTKQAFRRWREPNPVLEVRVIAESNGIIRQTLLTRYHLLPEHLQEHAMDLIGHYDKWFEVFENERNSGKPEAEQAPYIFAGTHGVPFPHAAEDAFVAEMNAVRARLRGAVGAAPAT